MRGAQPFETLLGALAFLAVGRERDDPLPGLFSAAKIPLSEREHDALVEERLYVSRVQAQRYVELRERAIDLVRVVVADAQVRARVHVLRVQFEHRLVPGCRQIESLGVEVEIRQFEPGVGVVRARVGRAFELGRARGVERRRGRRRLRSRTGSGSGRLRGGCGRRRRGLLTADDPPDQQTEARASDEESQRLTIHERTVI